jgi:hypothetical protein
MSKSEFLTGVLFNPEKATKNVGLRKAEVEDVVDKQHAVGLAYEIERRRLLGTVVIQSAFRGWCRRRPGDNVAYALHCAAGRRLLLKMAWIWRARTAIATRARRQAAATRLAAVGRAWLAVAEYKAEVERRRVEAERQQEEAEHAAALQIQSASGRKR